MSQRGLDQGRALLALPDRPTAIFAGTTCRRSASTRRRACRACAMPDDLSVVGFDDLPMARWAVATADHDPPAADRDGRDGDPDRAGRRRQTRVELATSLVVRQSTVALGT